MIIDIHFESQLATDATNMTVNQFHRTWSEREGELDLQPTFQRNFVWNDRQKALLIDSILRGVPIPEIYIQRKNDAEGNEKIVVVDGQQRLTSCLSYIDNQFKIPKGEIFGQEWQGRYFSDLEEEDRKRFRGFKFIVRELPDSVSPEDLRQIFQRLNTTVVSLNSPELRNAAYSNDFTELVSIIAKTPVFSEMGLFSANDYKRRKNEEFVAEVFDAYHTESFPNKKDGLDELYQFFDSQELSKIEVILDRASVSFGRVLRVLEPLTSELKRTRFRNKSDAYSLMVYLLFHAKELDTSTEFLDNLKDALMKFSDAVNNLKRASAQNELELDYGKSSYSYNEAASTYLGAVERSASDRLNRVRRNSSLKQLLDDLMSSEAEQLSSDDDVRRMSLIDDETDDEDVEEVN